MMYATTADLADYLHDPSIIDNPQAHMFVDRANEWVGSRVGGFDASNEAHTGAARRAVCALAAEWLSASQAGHLKRYRAGQVEMEYRDEVSGWGALTALTALRDAGLWTCCRETG